MKTSYLYQGVNLLSSVLLLVLILAYLDPGRYLQWVLFTTIAGASIQLESSLSVLMTRFISRAVSLGGPGHLAQAVRTARRAYRRFAIVAGLSMLVAGGAYLAAVDGGRFSPTWPIEWLIICAAYFVVYYFANYVCVLVALERASSFAAIALASRVLNLALSVPLILTGFGTLGLASSIGVSFGANAAALRAKARRVLAAYPQPPVAPEANGTPQPFAVRTVFIHAAFIFGSYSLYRVGLLVNVGTSADTAFQASFGLALQILTMIMAVALVPVTMRVTPLVSAVTSQDQARITREIATLSVYVNLAFVAAAVALVAFSGTVDQLLPNRGASLPSRLILAEMSFAFFIEINIFIFVNVLLAAQKYRFAQDYYLSAAVALSAGFLLWLAGLAFHHAFILVPALVQTLIALPAIARRVRRETGVAFGAYLGALGRHLLLVLRHPIKVGLAFQ